MEFYQELLLTAVISILLAFLVGKLAALDSDADDLDRASPADPIGEKRHEGGGLEGEADPFREESVDDGLRATEVLGSDPVESNEVVGDDGMDGEKSLSEGGVARSEEARAGETDLEKESREEKISEAKEARLEGGSVKEISEMVRITKVDDEGRSARDGAEVEIVRSLGELSVEEKGCEGEIGRGQKSGTGEKAGSLLHGEDEWEGIERSELEKLFGVAMAYINSASGGDAVSRLSSDVQMQLNGLYKVATEGPCYEPQPLALKVSARTKWHAWQILGNMDPEVAMEQYLSLLSHSIPGWMGEKPGGDAKQDEGNDPPQEGVIGTGTPDSGSSLHSQLSSKIVRGSEPSSTDGDNSSAGPELSAQGLAKTFFLNLLSPTTVRFLSFYW